MLVSQTITPQIRKSPFFDATVRWGTIDFWQPRTRDFDGQCVGCGCIGFGHKLPSSDI